jgi:hypothetical protein
VLQSGERNFTTLVYSVLLNVGKSVLKMMKTSWRDSLIIAKKNVRIIQVSVTVITITFSEKILEALLSYQPLQNFEFHKKLGLLVRSYKHGNELSSIKGRNFPTQLNHQQLLKKVLCSTTLLNNRKGRSSN